jgi:hypothetical protein
MFNDNPCHAMILVRRPLLRDNDRRIAPVFPPETNIMLDDWKRAGDLINFGNAAALNDSWTGEQVTSWLSKAGC